MKKLIPLLLLGFVCFGVIAACQKNQERVVKYEAKTGDKMTYWIDVRTAEEFSQGHVSGAINIPYEIIGGEIASITRDVDSDIRVYCRSGHRSGIAKNTLNGMGYANVINEGGYQDLVARKASGEPIP